jgi:PAS domain S-box-containing protein
VHEDSAIAEVSYRDTLDGSERRLAFLLKSISAMLAVVYFLEAGWLLWRKDNGKLLFGFALANAIIFCVLRLALAKVQIPRSWSQPLAGVATLLATLYALAGLSAADEPWGTTQLLIIVLMAGFVFISRAWFTALVIVACVGWFLAASSHLSQDAWVQMGGALLLTVIWSMWFLETRMRSLTAFEKKSAQQEHQWAHGETQIFSKMVEGSQKWCPICMGSPDAVIRHNNGEKILDANRSATDLLGMAQSELEAMAPINLFAQEFRADKKFLNSESFEWSEKVALKKDKTGVAVKVINGRIGEGSGGVMALVLRDATERVRARERSAAAMERVQLLVGRQAELANLAKIGDSAENRKALLDGIVAAAQTALPCTIGAFVVVKDGEARVEASSAARQLEIERLKMALFTWLANKNESLVVPKITEDADGVRALYPAEQIESFVATPIVTGKGLVGFLLTLENRPREYAPADLDFLTVLAYRAARCLSL